MDLQYFLSIIWRRKWLILSIALLAALATYFFIDRRANTYKANGVMTTRIVGERGVDMRQEKPWIMEFYVKMGFENMIEAITSKRNINFLTSRLLIHDLGGDTTSVEGQAFRRLADMEDVENLNYSPYEIEELIDTLKVKVKQLDYTFSDPHQQQMFEDLAKAFKYDYKNILKYNLHVERSGDTDNLNMQYESENPYLSAFAVNTFAEDYVRIYQENKQNDGDNSVSFLESEAKEAKDHLLTLENKLNSYKSTKNLYDAGDESQGIITRRNDISNALEQERAKIPALRANIRELDRLLQQKMSQSNAIEQSSIYENKAVVNKQRQLQELNDKIIKSNYTDEVSIKLYDLTKKSLDDQLEKLAKIQKQKENLPDNKRSQATLFNQKVEATMALNDANERIKTLERDLSTIDSKQKNLVTSDAVVKNLESEIAIARKDYEMIQYRLSEAKLLVRDTYQPLKILEYASVPEKPESKQKLLLTAFSGVVGGILSTVLIFITAFFDNSLSSTRKFQKLVDADLLSTVNKINTDNLDLQYLFSSNGQNEELDTFKESLRNLRFQIENSDAKRFLFTSTRKNTGKTFLIVTLSHALTIKGKKILIIDTNFKNNTLTQMSKQSIDSNLLNSKLIGENNLDKEFVSKRISDSFNLKNVDIIGNKGSLHSPSEVFAGKNIQGFLERLDKQYDYIFFEGAPLNQYTDTKELTPYVDKIISVFDAEDDVSEMDKRSIDYLKNLNGKYMGAILNRISLKNLG